MRRDIDSTRFLLFATALTLVLSFVPFASFAVYPFRLFVTFIHEGAHALATLVSLGAVKSLVIHPDGSGETRSLGGLQIFTASAGYLGAALYGAALLILCRHGRNAKGALTLTAAGILALTIFFAGNLFTWVTGLLLVTSLIGMAAVASVRTAHFFLSFLAVQCCLNAVFDLRTLFLISTLTNSPNDARIMEQLTLIPAVIWASAWIGLSLVFLWMALRSYSGSVRFGSRARAVRV